MLREDDKYKRPIGVIFDTTKGHRIAGHLKLKKADLLDSNVISIASDEFFHVADGESLHGISEAGKVSVLDCVRGGMLDITSRGDVVVHHGDVSFRYALLGMRHIAIDEACIRGIQFTLEGADASVFPRDKIEKFGHLHNPDEAILDAIKITRPEYLKGEFVKGKAMVSYFTGNWDFLPRFKTVLGTVHVGRSMQIDSFGRDMKDTPRIAVDFDDDPTPLAGAWEKMRWIRQFFTWMMGYAPPWKDVVVSTSRLDGDGFRANPDGDLEVFGPNEWEEVPEAARQCGTLVDASHDPDHFISVMQKWLERNENARRKNANARFFNCFPGTPDHAIEDGIVSAANTFDLLPKDDKPKAEPLPENVLNILKDAKTKVRSCMPDGEQKNDVLNALGRIRHNRRLRHIVEHRAEVVLNHFGKDRLNQLDVLIGLAVKCRNYYTHGPDDGNPGNVDYTDIEVVFFLTKTLEFIYGASELLLCGWNPAKSVGAQWHPLQIYVTSYDAKRSIILGLQ